MKWAVCANKNQLDEKFMSKIPYRKVKLMTILNMADKKVLIQKRAVNIDSV